MLRKCSTCKQEKELTCFCKGKTSSGLQSRCKLCTRKYNAQVRKQKVTNDLCKTCTKPRLHNCDSCLFHWAYAIVANQATAKNKNLSYLERLHRTKRLLGKLSNQNFKCFYTGVPLVPGLNASLDHIEPHSKSGNNEFSNLVWADRTFNMIKSSGNIFIAKEKFSNYLQALKTNEYPVYE